MQYSDANTQTIPIKLLGKEWLIQRPASLEELWDRLAEDGPVPGPQHAEPHFPEINMDDLMQAFEEDDRIPYWTEIWPAGIALAEWIARRGAKIKNRFCLDLGCGLGLSAVIGAAYGAKVVGMDYEPLALYYAARNDLHNNRSGHTGSPVFVAADWRKPAFRKGAFDLIWAGDIMYERRFMNPVAEFINHCLAPSGTTWIAEPGRGIYPEFARKMQQNGWRVEIVERLQAALPGSAAPPSDIQIWQLSRKNP